MAAGSLGSPMAHNEPACECEIAAAAGGAAAGGAAAVLDGTVDTGQTRPGAGGSTAEAPQPGAAGADLTRAHRERRVDARPEERAQRSPLDVVDTGRQCEYWRGRAFEVPRAGAR